MPSLLLGSDLADGLIDAFDVLLAPVFASIDNFDCYLDPALTPEDFLPWLASWVGVSVNERWSEERQRGFAARAVELYLGAAPPAASRRWWRCTPASGPRSTRPAPPDGGASRAARSRGRRPRT